MTPTTTAGRATATATCRRAAVAPTALALLAIAGCGGATVGRTAPAASLGARAAASSFSWLRPLAPAAGWRVARIADGATLAYPRSWQAQRGDSGSASAALMDSRGRYVGYLNVTPRQSTESLANWVSFRARHNRAEGDREVRVLASASGLRFRGGTGTCLMDSYTTSSGSRYVEMACLVGGASSAVVVGATPPGDWRAQSATIERAIASA